MKKYVVSSAVAAAFFAVCMAWTCLPSSPAAAQQPAASRAPGTPTGVALVDVGYILKRHVRLAEQKKQLKAEADALQKEFEEQGRQLQEKAKQLAAFKPGTPDYNQREEELNKEKATLQTEIQHKRREFIQREAHLLYNAYIEISQEVRNYCEVRGIPVVLNFDHESLHDDNPENVARALSNPVVYFNRYNDITPDVMQRFVNQLPPSGPITPAFNTPTQR